MVGGTWHQRLTSSIFTGSDRSVSELYGTVLIISLTFIVAILIVGTGAFVIDQLESGSQDRLAQDSMVELDDRISSLSAAPAEHTTTMSFPADSSDDIDAHPGEGVINVTVKTHDEDWEITADFGGEPGDLVLADERAGNNSMALGTLRHEANDGTITAYQGGAVWQKQDGHVSIETLPSLEVNDNRIDFSFVDISDLEQVLDGDEITLSANPEASERTTSEFREVIDERMRNDDGYVVARVDLELNITSEFYDGWYQYATAVMDGVDESDVERYPDEERVVIDLGTRGEKLPNLPDLPDPYDDDVVYTGQTDFAPLLHDPQYEIEPHQSENFGYRIVQPKSQDRAVGIYYDHTGTGGGEWWVWRHNDRWENVENATAEDLDPDEPEVVSDVGGAGNNFGIDNQTWTCILEDVEEENFGSYVDEEDEGCLAEPVGISNPGDHVADTQAEYIIESFDVTAYDEDGNELNPNENRLLEGSNQLEVDVTVKNTGSAEEEMPIGVVYYEMDEDFDAVEQTWLAQGELAAIEMGETEDFTFDIDPGFSTAGNFEVGAGTPNDAVAETDREDYIVRDIGNLDVEIASYSFNSDGYNPGNSITAGEESIELEVEVHLDDDDEELEDVTQTIALLDSDNNPRALAEAYFDAPDDNEATVTLEWETTHADHVHDQVEINASTDEETVDVHIEDPEIEPEFDVTDIETNSPVHVGEFVDVTATIVNQGDTGAQQVSLYREEQGGDDAFLDANATEIEHGESAELMFDWLATEGAAVDSPHTLRVEPVGSEHHSMETTVTVEHERADSYYEIDNLDVSQTVIEPGETIEVTAGITNTGDETGEQNVVLSDLLGHPVDAASAVEIAPGESETVTLTWRTDTDDVGQGNITVTTLDDAEETTVIVEEEEERVPELELNILDTNADVAHGQSITVGDPLSVEMQVQNTGDGAAEQTLVLEDFDGNPVNATDVTLSAGDSETVTLVWHTFGVDTGEEGIVDELTATIDDATDTREVEIESLTQTRDPVDVAFVLDETGSMGAYSTWRNWMYIEDDFELSRHDPVHDRTVPDGEHVWYISGDYYVSGQTVDPDDYWGDPVTVNSLDIHPDCSMCYDGFGDRYFATLNAIGALNETAGDQVSLTEFTTTANTYQPLTNNFDAANESLHIDPGGGTSISAGLLEGDQELNRTTRPENDRIIVLLTDGEHNTGTPPDDPAVYEQVHSETTVYAIGFGDADPDELQTVVNNAGTGEGEFYDAEHSDRLEEVFEDVIDDVTQVEPPIYEITSVQADQDPIEESDQLGVSVDIENVGDGVGDQPIALLDPDGVPVDSQTVNLTAGEHIDDLQLTWDTTNFLEPGEDESIADLTVLTPNDESAFSVTVERPPQPAFHIEDVTMSPDEPIEAGEALQFDVDVRNVGDAAGQQSIQLIDPDGQEWLAGTDEAISLGVDETETVEVVWDTTLSDYTVQEVQIKTDDDDQIHDVFIDPATIPEPEFEVDILSTNADPADGGITVGETLEVLVEVTNTNDEYTAFDTIRLEGFDEEMWEADQVALEEGESKQVWLNTTALTSGEDEITVELETADDEDTTTIEIAEYRGVDVPFEINDVSTNDPIDVGQGDTLEVEVTIENRGDEEDTQDVWLERPDDGGLLPGDVMEEVTIAGGAEEVITIEWDSPRTHFEEIVVRTHHDREQVSTDITRDESDFDLEIDEDLTDATESGESVVAGEATISVSVDITENDHGTETPVSLWVDSSYLADSIDIDPGQTTTVTLDWETRKFQGDDDEPITLTVQGPGVEDETAVYVDLPPGIDPDGPVAGGDGGIGFDIDDIQVD